MRLSTPDSRRKTRLKASAENVVASTLMPAIPGTITSRSACWSLKIAPNRARNSSGSRKLKNAALGLRQNSRRSRRYWRQVSAASDLIGGQLQVDLLQRRPRDLELLQALAARQRLRGQVVQQRGRVVGDVLDELARVRVPVAHPDPPRRVDAQLARRALGEDQPALDDR